MNFLIHFVLAIKKNFSEEDQKLAELIGLLHDIGRFEQVRIYNTFVDKISVNHGEMGVKVLFEDGLIEKFVETREYDNIIKTAILNHNKGIIDSDVSGKELEFCKIIRDADKTDICYILLTDSFENIYGKDDISDEWRIGDMNEEDYNKVFDPDTKSILLETIFLTFLLLMCIFHIDYTL